MASYKEIAGLKPQPSDNDNRILVVWVGPDGVQREYAINQRTLNKYVSEAEVKAALDSWTQNTFGYVLDDIWFHRNRDGTWAVATGQPPAVWPEDQGEPA